MGDCWKISHSKELYMLHSIYRLTELMKMHMCKEREAVGDNYNYHMSISIIINEIEKHA